MYIALSIVALGAVLIASGFLYQVVGSHRDKVRFAAAGRWVEIGPGHRLYMLEKGAGGPTVLFEAGIAATNLNWCHIQETVARFTHTVSYDRGGLGWSGPSYTARTPGNCASELHDLLERANIKPPYILVGHSFGGLVMRRYALSYPEEVSGVVLVDPMRCEEWPPMNPSRQPEIDRIKKLSGYAVPIARFGLARLAVTSLLCRSGRISGHLAGAGGACRAPCPAALDRGSRQDAQGGLAHRRSALVPSRLLRWHEGPRQGRARHGARDAGRRPHPRHPRAAAHARKIHAALRHRRFAASGITCSR